MQIFEASLCGADRPLAPRDCPECGGGRKLWCHGTIRRCRGSEGDEKAGSSRFLCVQCGHTWSVIPADMLPYRSMAASRFESLMDERFGLAGRGARPPPATEIEEGCIRRAYKVLSKRIPFLCGLLGQQMPLGARAGVGCFWRALRELGPTGEILVRLAREFKTSLLACYLSLRSHWERKEAPD
ncbi:hypothetical protein BH09VER1_BH09VER1_56400 [soil metagenome]